MNISSLIVKPLPDEYASEFRIELLRDNLSRIKVFSFIIIIGSLVLLSADIINYVNGLWVLEGIYRYEFYLHLVLLMVMGSFIFLLMIRRRKHNPSPEYIWFEYFFIFFLLLWSSVFYIIQIPVSMSTVFFMITCFIVAVGVYSNTFVSIASYSLSFIVLLAGLSSRINDVGILSDCISESGAIILISLAISRLIYKKRTEVFLNYKKIEKEILDKDMAELSLNKLNAELESIVKERTKALIETNEKLNKEISDKISLEEKLTYEKNFLENIIEYTPYAVSIFDRNGFYLRGNPASEKLQISLSPSEYNLFNDPILSEKFPELFEKVKQGNPVVFPDAEYNTGNIHADFTDKTTWFRTIISPIKKINSEIDFFLVIHEDITEKKLAETALRLSEERYRLIVENIDDGIYSTKKGIFLSVNQAMVKMFGYSVQELTNMPAWNLAVPEIRDFVRNEFLRKVSAKDSSPVTVECLKKTGEIFYAEISINGISESGFAYGIVHDITDRKRAEEILVESEERYRILIDNMSEVFILLDVKGTLIYISRLFEKLTGYKTESVLGKPLTDIIVSEDLPGYIENFSGILSCKHEPYECRLNNSYGKCINVRISCKLIEKSDNTKQIIGILSDITDRKQAENDLRMLESAINQSFDGIAVADLEGNFIYLNKSWAKMHGYNREELIGKNLKVCHSNLQITNEVIPFNIKVLKDGQHQGEVGHMKKDGSLFPTWMTTTLLRGESNRPTGLIGIARDISFLKQAEEELKLSEKKYRSLFNKAPSGILTVDLNGNVQDANKATLSILGSQSIELTKQINVLTFPNLNEAGISQKLQECIATSETLVSEHFYTTKWGKSLHIRIHFKPVFDDDENITEVLAIIDDISREKETEINTIDRLEQLKCIMETSSEGVVVINRNGHIVLSNTPFHTLTGFSKTDIEKTGISDFLFPFDLGHYLDLAEKNIYAKNIELRFKKKNNSFFWALASTAFCKNRQNEGFLILVIRDYSELKELQADLLNLKNKLCDAEKFMVSTLKNLSHELKISANAIHGFSQILKIPGEKTEKIKFAASSVAEKSEVLLKTVNDFILISQIESKSVVFSKTEIDPFQVIEDILLEFSNDPEVQKKKLLLFNDLDKEPGTRFQQDYRFVRRILEELVRNSIKNTHYGSISVGCCVEDDHVKFHVIDTGAGLPPEKQKNYFEALRHKILKEHSSGMNGLMICKGLVDLTGGKIWVVSDEGKGSVFYFTIPV